MSIVRWPLFFIVVLGLIAWWAFISSGGCAPGAPEFKASDLVQATVKNLYPAGGGVPVVTTIDLGKTGGLDKLLAAYRSMKRANETSPIVHPDLYLSLKLKGDREIVVVLAKDTRSFVEIREYRSGGPVRCLTTWWPRARSGG